MIELSYNEILEVLHNNIAVPLSIWKHIDGRIKYDAASTVPGAINMLSILRERVMNGESIKVTDTSIVLTHNTFYETIEKCFGGFIRGEL